MLPVQARPSIGAGERLSRNRGPGMEFLDYRPYQEGDDTRHLDPYLYARTGDFVLRQYARTQQLPVTVVLDLSGSMAAARDGKLERAKEISQVLGFVALAGGDRVQIVVPSSDGLRFSDRWHGAARADFLFDWVAKQPTGKHVDFSGQLADLRQHLPSRGLVVVISDWWDENTAPALEGLFAADQEVLAIQVLSEAEIDPSALGQGVVTMEDAESGDEIELAVDADLINRYRDLFTARQDSLRG